ncbi:MAG: hypothetical protein FWF66_00735 [Candidatus Bathyarchaeota archaeon]|nr:hypothetical protein [Candidatus Termiticorpusculum sp.]
MSIESKIKNGLHCFCNRKNAAFISLLFIITLTASCIISEYNTVSFFVSGAPDKVVNNETELRDAINNAPDKYTFTIALNNDITLTDSALIIPANKDIILTSSKLVGFYKLIGAYSRNTIIVKDSGILKIDGIIITNSSQSGVTVRENGLLILYRGEISGISDNSFS